jgi:hypothetical protein
MKKLFFAAFLTVLAIGLVATLAAMEGSQSYLTSSEVMTGPVLLIAAGCGTGILLLDGEIIRSHVTRETTALALTALIIAVPLSGIFIALPNAFGVNISLIVAFGDSVGATIVVVAISVIAAGTVHYGFFTGAGPPILSSVKTVVTNGAGSEGRARIVPKTRKRLGLYILGATARLSNIAVNP